MRIILIFLIITILCGCSRTHYTKKHPWKPKRGKHLDLRYERCYNFN